MLTVTQSGRCASCVSCIQENTAIIRSSPLNIKAHPLEHLLSVFNTTVQFALLSSEGTWSHICYQATDFADGGVLPRSACGSCFSSKHKVEHSLRQTNGSHLLTTLPVTAGLLCLLGLVQLSKVTLLTNSLSSSKDSFMHGIPPYCCRQSLSLKRNKFYQGTQFITILLLMTVVAGLRVLILVMCAFFLPLASVLWG